MKRSKIFLATGAFILAITAMFATKANKRFKNITTVYFGNTGLFVTDNTTGVFTNTASSGKACYATLYTATSLHSAFKLNTKAAGNGNTVYHG